MFKVMTTSPKSLKINGEQVKLQKNTKFSDKSRPITATLEYPLVLDIKLLKRLDMTTFTKKSLIALSKFCGISLINTTETKRKLNKCILNIQNSKKKSESDSGQLLKGSGVNLNAKDYARVKKRKISKLKPQICFKVTEESKGWHEDPLNNVCKKNDTKNQFVGCKDVLQVSKSKNAQENKIILDDLLSNALDNVIAEPCKTCCRSEHPERFHSHPKMSFSLSDAAREKLGNLNFGKQLKDSLATKGSEKDKNLTNDSRISHLEEQEGKHTNAVNCTPNMKSPSKNASAVTIHSTSETTKKKESKIKKKSFSSTVFESKSVIQSKPMNVDICDSQKNINSVSHNFSTADDTMKFITGCYICGQPVSPKTRIKHEEGCILEWRAQNNSLPAEKKRKEPQRPDYRFTISGDLDPEGTFESIWMNHKESLVPCKKCGRKFFLNRIERHEHCCKNLPVKVKYKHQN